MLLQIHHVYTFATGMSGASFYTLIGLVISMPCFDFS
jgi:hypothetical protein